MKLTLVEWAHLAEVVGAVAIVASLIFVGVQLQQNSREVRAATAQSITDTDVSVLLELARSRDVGTTWRYYLDFPESLEQPELFQGTDLATVFLRNFENVYEQQEIIPDKWESYRMVVDQLLKSKGLMCFFATSLNAQAFVGEFRDRVIDPALAESPFKGRENECPSLVRPPPAE